MPTNSFAALIDNKFTRRWAGSTGSTVDPYVSGYFFTHWAYLPPKLGDAIKVAGGPDAIESTADAAIVLQSSCLAVTIPGGTVNKAEFTGLGGVKWSVPTNVEFDNTVTFKFLEFSTLPILAIMHGWTRLIRDYRTGVSHIMGEGGEGVYTKAEYSATCYYWTTKPDGKTVEYFACLSGLFPMKDPTDQYGGDITTYDKLELDLDFSVDYLWHEPWVKARCQALADDAHGDRDKIDGYGQSEPEA